MKRSNLVPVSLRLDGDVLRVVDSIARLSGQKREQVVAVLLAFGTLKHVFDSVGRSAAGEAIKRMLRDPYVVPRRRRAQR